MRKYVISVSVLLSLLFVGCATAPEQLPPEQLMRQEVFKTDKPQDELYDVSMEWMAKTFRSAKAVIEYQDKEVGKIIGKGVFPNIPYGFTFADVHFTPTVETKDNKARLTVDSIFFRYRIGTNYQESSAEVQQQMDLVNPKIDDLFVSYEVALQQKKESW